MIHLFLEQAKKRYLEVVLEAFECNRIIDSLSLLKTDKLFKYDGLDFEGFKGWKGYSSIESIAFVYCSNNHIANTEYNIKCSLIGLHEVEICITSEGIQELQSILEYVRDKEDHFHLFGGFNLYTGEDDKYSDNILDTITIYNTSNYWETFDSKIIPYLCTSKHIYERNFKIRNRYEK